MKYDPENIIRKVSNVASLPEVFMKIEETLNDPTSSTHHLGKIVQEDPGLTARLLRLVNSAYYSFTAKVETVNQAITVIGTQQLRDLVLACSVMKAFKNITSDLVDMESFWRHSVACGVVAKALATQQKASNTEHYFVSGLLHDVGRLILFSQLPDKMGEVVEYAKEEKLLLFKAEQKLLGFNHAYLGGLLLKDWKLSQRLIESVGYHHAPTNAKSFPIDAAIVHVADLVANAMRMGSSGERYVPKLNERAWESLNLSQENLEQIMLDLEEKYTDAIRFILDD